jgi:glycosyltransferase involved in cell wall biosynthesis
VHTFYNPSFSVSDLQAIKTSIEQKSLSEPIQLLFVGRTDHSKGIGVVLTILKNLVSTGIPANLVIIGDGPERPLYEQMARELGVKRYAHFLGWKDRVELNDEYAKAHFILLPSVSEGWPKVLSEAMAYGVVPLASDVSSIPQILGETKAGHAFPADQPKLFVEKIIQYTFDKKAWKTTSQYGLMAANLFTYETYLDSVKKLFYNSWRIELID